MRWTFLRGSEISRVMPTLEVFHRTLDQQLSPGIGPKQVGGTHDPLQYYQRLKSCSLHVFPPYFQNFCDSGPVSCRLEQLTKLLYSIEDKVKYCNMF